MAKNIYTASFENILDDVLSEVETSLLYFNTSAAASAMQKYILRVSAHLVYNSDVLAKYWVTRDWLCVMRHFVNCTTLLPASNIFGKKKKNQDWCVHFYTASMNLDKQQIKMQLLTTIITLFIQLSSASPGGTFD